MGRPRIEARPTLTRWAAERAAEAAAAAGILDVSLDLLGLPDGGLEEHTADAARSVGQLIEALAPTDVFVTWRHEPHADHRAAVRAVTAPLALGSASPQLHEYPVWYWHRPPWCPIASVGRREALRSRGR